MVLIAGAMIGRYWAIPLLAMGWAIALIIDGSCRGDCVWTSLLLAGVNAVVGVAIGIGIRRLFSVGGTRNKGSA